MYNIGIFGDSYTNSASDFEDHLQWWEYLNEYCDKECKIDNYGVAGSSLYFSYQNFIKHHEKYDKVIFLYTSPNRLWMPQYSEKSINGEHIHSVDHADRRFVKGTPLQKKIKDAIEKYYVYINNPDEHRDYWELMIADVRAKRPDALVLPCFYKSKDEIYWPVVDISKIDDRKYHVDIMNDCVDIRANHFNYKNSKIFSKNVADWLMTGNFRHEIKDYKSLNLAWGHRFCFKARTKPKWKISKRNKK